MIITTVSELTIHGKLSLGAGRSSKDLFAFYGSNSAAGFTHNAQRMTRSWLAPERFCPTIPN
jgi:hypothetical protein